MLKLGYMICYHCLINAHKEIGRAKAHEYYLRYRRFIQSNQSSLINDKNFYYTLSGEHYRNRGEYETALKYNDSTMMLKNTGASLITSHTSLYKSRAALLKLLNQHEEACTVYEAYIQENDSLIQKTHAEKLSEMRVIHEVDKLEIERSNILSEKHRNNLYFSLFICAFILLVATYLFFSLQKERRLKKELEEQREKSNWRSGRRGNNWLSVSPIPAAA